MEIAVKKKHAAAYIPYLVFFPSFIALLVFFPIFSARAAEITNRDLLFKLDKNVSQLLLVTNNCPSSFIVQITALEKKDGKWEEVFPSVNGVIGKNGFALPEEKREGDGRTPAGIFPLKISFGYKESIPTKMPYRQSLSDDLWVDDINALDYNRWVKEKSTKALSFERMRRDDDLYKYGLVIEYNTAPVVKGYGSAIFFHVWRGKNRPTEGCVAVSEDNIVRILKWLDPQAAPLIIMGAEDMMEQIAR